MRSALQVLAAGQNTCTAPPPDALARVLRVLARAEQPPLLLADTGALHARAPATMPIVYTQQARQVHGRSCWQPYHCTSNLAKLCT